MRTLLLACGVGYSLLYVVANDVIAASLYEGYDRSSQAISELSAAGSPARPFLSALLPISGGLLIAFGIGVWRSARDRRALRVVGRLLVAQGFTAFLWLLAPMSQREEIAAHGGTLEDALHLVLSGASILFILAELGFGATALGKLFRRFTIAMIATFLVSCAALAVMSLSLVTGQSTPYLGIVERVMLGAWLLWMPLLALALMQLDHRMKQPHSGTSGVI